MPEYLRLPVIPLALSLTLAACVDSGTGGSDSQPATGDNFDFTSMFVNYADNIILPNYAAVAELAAPLGTSSGSIASYCESIASTEESAARESAGSQWENLMDAVQATEMHLFGPALDNNSSLTYRLNSSAAGELSLCGVDQALVQASEDSSFSISSKTVVQRGIGAVEYLLFSEDLNHHCPSQITETADWDGRPDNEKKRLRCDYAITIAQDIADAAETLHDAWSSTSGDYRSRFVDPANVSDSLTALSDALFYLDLDVKDRKLGVPIGINDGCPGISCPDAVESPYREYSLAGIRANLVAFGTLMTGADGPGFDDLIDAAGMPELNRRFTDHTATAVAVIDNSNDSLVTQAAALDTSAQETECINAFANPDVVGEFPACNLLGHIKALTDDLKVGFVAAINVDLPDRAQTDND